jgi:hypothetical protein
MIVKRYNKFPENINNINNDINNESINNHVNDNIDVPINEKVNNDIVNEPVNEPINENIKMILEELIEKYGNNEAVENITIEEDEVGKYIQFNVKCETDISSANEYNGIRLKFNKLCEINQDKIENIDDNDEMTEEEINESFNVFKEQLLNEYLDSIKFFFIP